MSLRTSLMNVMKVGKASFSGFDGLVLGSMAFAMCFVTLQYVAVFPESDAQKALWAQMYADQEATVAQPHQSAELAATGGSEGILRQGI